MSERRESGSTRPALPPAPDGAVPGKRSPLARAASAVWAAGLAEIIVFGACAIVLGLLAMTPIEQLQQAAAQQLSPEEVRQRMGVAAGVVAVTMWLPGLLLIFLGFGVKEGRPGQMLAGALILVAQAALLTPVVVLAVVNLALAPAMLGNAIVPLVLTAGVLALVARAIVRLVEAWRAMRAAAAAQDEPWNSHLV